MVATARVLKRGIAALLLAVPALAAATTLEVSVERVATAAVVLEAVEVELTTTEADPTTGDLAISARSLVLVDTPYQLDAPRWRCTLQRTDDGWHCAGAGRAKQGKGQLAATLDDAQLEADFSAGAIRLQLGVPLEEGATRIRATAIPAAWLQPLLAAAWPEARFTEGTLGGELQLLTDDDSLRLDGTVRADGLGLDTADGRIAAAGLSLQGPLALQLAERTTVDTTLALAGGELLAGPVYASLPETGVQLQVTGSGQDDDWSFDTLRWTDAAALEVRAQLTLAGEGEGEGTSTGPGDADDAAWLRSLTLQASSPDLSLATSRYLESLLATFGLGGLALHGKAELELAIDVAGMQGFSAEVSDFTAEDAAGRFALQQAAGSLGWHRSEARAGEFGWQTAALYGLPLGASELAWQSRQGQLALTRPATIPMLGGTLAIEQFAWHPDTAAANEADAGDAGDDGSLALALAVRGVDLGALAQRLDWPPFTGTLGGRIPSAHYADGVLTLEGGLDLDVFDGQVNIGTLTLERPFGVAPTLGADIGLRGLDLVPLTGAFGFGSISGRLDGRINGLRLVDWEPVAFDADFRTSTSAPDKRRISQRAVSDLTSVGGGGIAAGIQAQVLRMFDTFPYERIGLSCKLENNLCLMGGLAPADPSGGGYTIVEGSGLPHITVVGHQRRVDWPVLVSRLKAATEGQAPVVQ